MTSRTYNQEKKWEPEDERILQQWRRTQQIRESTFNNYRYSIRRYTKATHMTLTQLYNEALTEEEQHIPKHRRSIKTHILDYYDWLDKQPFTESTKNQSIYIVVSFYKSLDITLPNIPNNYDDTPLPENTEKMITPEIIRLMLDNASVRNKAIISFAMMTGQSPNELCHITILDIVKCWNSELEHPIFDLPDIWKYKQEILELKAPAMRIKRLKTNNTYWFYVPSETSRYIIEYIYERVAGRNTNIRIHSLDDPLFVNKMGEPCTAQNISKVFTVTGEKCGFHHPELFEDKLRLLLERKPGHQRVYCAYKFRKYFLNMCRRYAGTRPDTPTEQSYTGKDLGDFWIGHQDKGSISSYLQYDDSDVRELQYHYLQMLPYLSLEMEVDTITSEDKREFLQMKERYEDVLKEMEELRDYVRKKHHLDSLAKEYGLE